MGVLGKLIPLVILFVFVAGFAWVGYQVGVHSRRDTIPLRVQLR
jgi:hypothetical protein